MSDPMRSVAALYERHHQGLYRFCLSIVGNPEDAQDALQNAMLKAIRALPGERREIQLKPWLYRIAHNESVEILRKRREQVQIDPEIVASTGGPEETAATRQRLRRLLSDLGELPERQRGALVMRELVGLSFGEIGEALGASEAVARQTVYEARLGLHQLEAGREMSCESVMRQISDADGRKMRRRDIRAHLRACPDCRRFREKIEGRSHDLAAIAPLPAAASAGILHGLLTAGGGQAGTAAGASAGTGAGAASTIGAGAGKAVATSAVLKSAATVVAVAALGVGAADRSGVIHIDLPGQDSGTTVERNANGIGAARGDAGSTVGHRLPGFGRHLAGGHVAARAAAAAALVKAASATTANESGKGGDGSARSHHPTEGGHGSPAGPAPASEHGQRTAAAHKASPQHGNSAKKKERTPHAQRANAQSRGHGNKPAAAAGKGNGGGGNASQADRERKPHLVPAPSTEAPEGESAATRAHTGQGDGPESAP